MFLLIWPIVFRLCPGPIEISLYLLLLRILDPQVQLHDHPYQDFCRLSPFLRHHARIVELAVYVRVYVCVCVCGRTCF
jgi:hypothetical protein